MNFATFLLKSQMLSPEKNRHLLGVADISKSKTYNTIYANYRTFPGIAIGYAGEFG